jgi:hypothetical protein
VHLKRVSQLSPPVEVCGSGLLEQIPCWVKLLGAYQCIKWKPMCVPSHSIHAIAPRIVTPFVLTRWFVLRRGMMEVREGEEEGRSNLQIIGQPTIIARDGRELASRVRGANPYRPSEERSRAGFARIRESEERVVCQSVCLSESIITA